MFLDYLVLDNALDNPHEIIKLSKSLSYFYNSVVPDQSFNVVNKMENINWLGYRSAPIHFFDGNLFKSIFNSLFAKMFNDKAIFTYTIRSHFHFLPSLPSSDLNKWWHTDNSLFAGVIYLNENIPLPSGTLFKIKNEEKVIDNVFNRAVIYKSDITHRPQNSFGSTIDNSRFTISFFIDKLNLDYDD